MPEMTKEQLEHAMHNKEQGRKLLEETLEKFDDPADAMVALAIATGLFVGKFSINVEDVNTGLEKVYRVMAIEAHHSHLREMLIRSVEHELAQKGRHDA